MDHEAVLKYCEVVDEFVKIRQLDAGRLNVHNVGNRREYQRAVVEACTVDYHETVLPLFKKFNRIYKPEALEAVLYQIAVEVNPDLEIHQVEIPVSGDAQTLPLAQDYRNRIDGLETYLTDTIVGQPEAVRALSAAAKRAATQLKLKKEQPHDMLLFMGPTGVGKSELAKAFSKHMYGEPPVVLNGGAYALPHEVAKLTGAPPGYIGHTDGGHLTTAMIERTGRGDVIVDEYENAHPNVGQIFLTVADDGKLRDGRGKVAHFSDMFLIFSSNVGAAKAERTHNAVGFHSVTDTEIKKIYEAEAIEALPPELRGRLTRIVFNQLREEDCTQIAERQLHAALSNGGITNRVRVSRHVYREVAGMAEYTRYGARDVWKVLKSEILDGLADQLLDEKKPRRYAVSIKQKKIQVKPYTEDSISVE